MTSIATPLGKPAGRGALLTLRQLPYLAARVGILLAQLWGRPFRIGSTVIAARNEDVEAGLDRDLEFRIQPVNAPKFDQIGFHFILGMDRSDELIAERRVLYTALATVDTTWLQNEAAKDIERKLDAAGATIDVVEGYSRPIAGLTANRLFGIKPTDNAAFLDATRAIFGNSFLNVASDPAMTERALVAANLVRDWFEAEIALRRRTSKVRTDMMGALLNAGAGDDLIRRTLRGMLVGAIDTTATAVAKIMTVLMRDRELLTRAAADQGSTELMWGWCNEALRRWAHGPVIVRKAIADTDLNGTGVKAGDSVILWTQAAMLDASAFPSPAELRPDSAGARYLHFGGGLHPCAGRGINAWQIPMLVAALLRRNPAKLDPMVWAGPFPARLPIHLQGHQS